MNAELKTERNDLKIKDLQTAKFEARERLRAARIEMGQIDAKLHQAGASLADINMVCW